MRKRDAEEKSGGHKVTLNDAKYETDTGTFEKAVEYYQELGDKLRRKRPNKSCKNSNGKGSWRVAKTKSKCEKWRGSVGFLLGSWRKKQFGLDLFGSAALLDLYCAAF